MNACRQFGLAAIWSMLLALLSTLAIAAPPIQVTTATPSSSFQGTTSLDVTVDGSGFDNSAAVSFLVTGTTNPGGIIVRRVTVLGSKKLVATIDIADTAAISSFDIQVEQSGGRKGKGTSLFAVLEKQADPCAAASLDFPAFTYQRVVGQVRRLYVADATGVCSRLLIDTGTNTSIHFTQAGFSFPVDGSTDIGRVVWEEAGTIRGMTFIVSGTSIGLHAPQTIYAGDFVLALELSADGSVVYAGLDPGTSSGVGRVMAINVADLSVSNVYSGPADGSHATKLAANEDGTLFADWSDWGSSDARLLRIEPTCHVASCATVLASSAPGTSAEKHPAANPADSRLVYSDYLAGFNNCWLLQVIPDTGGANLLLGQPRYGIRSTWLDGQILTNSRLPPDRKGKCADTGMIKRIDPNTSAETTIVEGQDPDAR